MLPLSLYTLFVAAALKSKSGDDESMYWWECSSSSWYWPASEAIAFSALGVIVLQSRWTFCSLFTPLLLSSPKSPRPEATRPAHPFPMLASFSIFLILAIDAAYSIRLRLYHDRSIQIGSNILPVCRLAAAAPLFYWIPVLMTNILQLTSFKMPKYAAIPTTTHLLATGISAVRIAILFAQNSDSKENFTSQPNFKVYIAALVLQCIVLLLDFILIQRIRSVVNLNPKTVSDEGIYRKLPDYEEDAKEIVVSGSTQTAINRSDQNDV